jgi:hypothetical protein
MSVQTEIAAIREAALQKVKEAERLGRLLEAFPDLVIRSTRAGQKYCSVSINGRVDQFLVSELCSCCHDPLIGLWAFIETPDGRVYSNPERFLVGRRGSFGQTPKPNWQSEIRAAGLPEAIISGVTAHFKKAHDNAIAGLTDAYENGASGIDDLDPLV